MGVLYMIYFNLNILMHYKDELMQGINNKKRHDVSYIPSTAAMNCSVNHWTSFKLEKLYLDCIMIRGLSL